MDTTDLLPLLEQLDDNVDELEDALQPLLGSSLNKMSKNMPIFDKAKIHVLTTYALESLIFSYLRLQGVNALQHPVYREITRVKQYFAKMKALEEPEEPEQRTMVLDKAAAGRFIKHGLSGNDKIDLERAEREARERARAQLKAAMLAKKAASAAVQDTPAQSESAPSAVPSTAQSSAETDNSDEEMETDEPAQEFKTGDEFIELDTKKKKKNFKEEKAKSRSESGKKHGRKATKAERRQEKKDRRRKKEETRKVREAK
ncbi:Nuclear nucleic acid-binding protein C1D [Penicillium rolfsii]|nr:Nuclear nucleic acid-binding protein C1D [Penicillium rolfsii]